MGATGSYAQILDYSRRQAELRLYVHLHRRPDFAAIMVRSAWAKSSTAEQLLTLRYLDRHGQPGTAA